jgi:hypothetical protein
MRKDIVHTIIITDEHISEIYIERILRDWSKGEVLAVFANRNMKSASFNANPPQNNSTEYRIIYHV